MTVLDFHHPGNSIRASIHWQRHCIPLKLHVDAVPVVGVGKSWARSMDVYSVSSLVGQGSTLEMQVLIWAVMGNIMSKSNIRSHDTKSVFWKWLIWSLTQLQNGTVADLTPDGVRQPDAGHPLFGESRYRCVIFVVAADLEEYHKASHATVNLKMCVSLNVT